MTTCSPFTDDFAPADLARALLRAFIKNKVEKIRLTAAHLELKHIFFAGSLVNHEIVRQFITEVFTFCNYFYDATNRKVGQNCTVQLDSAEFHTKDNFKLITQIHFIPEIHSSQVRLCQMRLSFWCPGNNDKCSPPISLK